LPLFSESAGTSNEQQAHIERDLAMRGRTSCSPFHDDEEIGRRMLARIAKKTGLKPDDL
jgi:hypothetical protein